MHDQGHLSAARFAHILYRRNDGIDQVLIRKLVPLPRKILPITDGIGGSFYPQLTHGRSQPRQLFRSRAYTHRLRSWSRSPSGWTADIPNRVRRAKENLGKALYDRMWLFVAPPPSGPFRSWKMARFQVTENKAPLHRQNSARMWPDSCSMPLQG